MHILPLLGRKNIRVIISIQTRCARSPESYFQEWTINRYLGKIAMTNKLDNDTLPATSDFQLRNFLSQSCYLCVNNP